MTCIILVVLAIVAVIVYKAKFSIIEKILNYFKDPVIKEDDTENKDKQ